MRIEAKDAAALRAVLQKDRDAIAGLEEHFTSLAGSQLTRTEVDSLGFALHNLYNALENSFTQISLTFENHVKDPTRWHRELLEKMFLPIPPLRPAVLPVSAKPLLSDLLGFRHLFRHSYEVSLDKKKTVALWMRWQAEGPMVTSALQRFCDALGEASEEA